MSAKNLKFKAQTQKILHLVTHSLYSNSDIFLRELISNASDAIDKVRFESLTQSDILEGNSEWKIKIVADKENNTLTLSDNGIGMTEEEVIENLGTIAMSGTEAFLEMAKQNGDKSNPELIGQFGVGFYSAFMVADKIIVRTRKAGNENTGVQWECTGEEDFSIDAITKKGRGTDIILHINEKSKDYLEEWKIREIVKKYSDYIEFPVTMDIERSETPTDKDGKPIEGEDPVKTVEEETLNSKKAIWLRDKTGVTDQEYEEFYKHISHDFSKPLTHMHYSVEGTTEFTALIYIPSVQPFNLFMKEAPKNNVHLYVKRVFILKESEAILPEYLRFISGVVDSSDLPLNVSREHLQEHRVLKTIRKNLISKVLSTLTELKEKEYSRYKEFYTQFGTILKEGVYSDFERKESLLGLLLYQTTKTTDGDLKTLDQYIKDMPEDQKEVYYIPGESIKDVQSASHLEIFREKDYEVLYFVEPIDEIMMQNVMDYKDKKFKSIITGDINLDKKDEAKTKEVNEKFKSFNDFIKGSLDQHIKEVRISDRLTKSACCLVGDEHDMSAHLQKIMKAYNNDTPDSKRIMEINPNHQLIEKVLGLFETNKDEPRLKEYAELLYDQALIAEGSKIPDPVQFNERLSNLMLQA